MLTQWAECACWPLGGAGGSNLGRQAAPAASILLVSCLAQIQFGSRFGPDSDWRSPHFRAEGIAGAMRLLQKEEVREEGAGAVARQGYAAKVSMSQSGSEAVMLTESAADSSIGRSSSQKLAASVG